jgi:hypothetical protein
MENGNCGLFFGENFNKKIKFPMGFSFFADFSKSAKSANLLFAESAKISKSAKVTTLMKPNF